MVVNEKASMMKKPEINFGPTGIKRLNIMAVGASGLGKSTFLNCLVQQLSPEFDLKYKDLSELPETVKIEQVSEFFPY